MDDDELDLSVLSFSVSALPSAADAEEEETNPPPTTTPGLPKGSSSKDPAARAQVQSTHPPTHPPPHVLKQKSLSYPPPPLPPPIHPPTHPPTPPQAIKDHRLMVEYKWLKRQAPAGKPLTHPPTLPYPTLPTQTHLSASHPSTHPPNTGVYLLPAPASSLRSWYVPPTHPPTHPSPPATHLIQTISSSTHPSNPYLPAPHSNRLVLRYLPVYTWHIHPPTHPPTLSIQKAWGSLHPPWALQPRHLQVSPLPPTHLQRHERLAHRLLPYSCLPPSRPPTGKPTHPPTNQMPTPPSPSSLLSSTLW